MSRLLEKIVRIFHLRGLWYYVSLWFRTVFVLRYRYAKNLKHIRNKARAGEKIVVVFLVHDTSKWKCQSLYEVLARNNDFKPLIALTIGKFEGNDDEVRAKINSDKEFYEKLGDSCIEVLDGIEGANGLISIARPDIVFFQESWVFDSGELSVESLSRYALTFYVPYSVEFDTADCGRYSIATFHRMLFCNITWNRAQAKYMKRFMPFFSRAGRIEGLGHPIFDRLNGKSERSEELVIYAPHFSFPYPGSKRPLTISTFLQTGEFMLEYARKHTEFKWLFKPHPILRQELVAHGGWSKKKVDDYYAAWEDLGASCYDGDYVKLFRQSKAMITDCSSFLMEFPATGRPLIRMIPKENDANIRPSVQPFIDTLYTTYSISELEQALEKVVVKGEDDKRDERLVAMKKLDMVGNDASLNIVNYMHRLRG